MTTINNYSVSLALDASSYIRNSSLSRKETQSLIRSINQARTPAEQYERSLDKLDRALKAGAIDQQTYNRLLAEAKQKFHGATDGSNQFATGIGNLRGSIVRLGIAYMGFNMVKQFASDAVKLASEAESASISLEVLTGSVEESQKMLAELKRLAATTPLTLTDTQAAAKTMLSFNVEAGKILPTLQMMGAITGGNSERFKMLTLAFSQMSAAGRMMGQDLLQMINAGFNPLQEISRKTGESMLDLKKRMEAGAISSTEVAEAFESATAEGGKFFGMTERLSKTTEGRFAILKDSVDELKRALGELATTDFFAAQIEGATNFFKALKTGTDAITSGDIGVSTTGRRFGLKLPTGLTSKTETDSARQNEEMLAFMREQIARRRAGQDPLRTDGSLEKQKAAIADGVSKGFADFGSSLVSSVEGAGKGLFGSVAGIATAVAQAVQASTIQLAETNRELVKSVADSPAISSLEAGSQEAYQFLTQSNREAMDEQRRLEAEKKARDEKAEQQRQRQLQWLERLNNTLEMNGFGRIR